MSTEQGDELLELNVTSLNTRTIGL